MKPRTWKAWALRVCNSKNDLVRLINGDPLIHDKRPSLYPIGTIPIRVLITEVVKGGRK